MLMKKHYRLVLMFAPAALWGQYADLTGFIKDPSSAVVPNASVELRNQDTGIRQVTKSNADGVYALSELKPGVYQATVQANGFKTLTQNGIVLEVAQHARLDLSLQIGSTEEKVTVDADASQINSENASVSTVVNQALVENLPLNGRNFNGLLELTPGVVIAKTAIGYPGQFDINGQRANANYYTIDGVSANIGVSLSFGAYGAAGGSIPGSSVLGTTNTLLSADALEEFRVLTSSFAPEYGRTPGGQVSLTTRSGSNAFHGSLSEYFRNEKLDANDWFANSVGLGRAALRQNTYGGVFGGPIRHDKTFFFGSYEGLQLRQPNTLVGAQVPTVLARQAAPAALQPFLNAYPLPNGPDLGNGLATNNSTFSNPAHLDALGVRLDHSLTDKLRLYARYSKSWSATAQYAAGFPSGFPANNVIHVTQADDSGTAAVTWTPTNTVSNDLRFNYAESGSTRYYSLTNFGGAVVPSNSVLYPINGDPSTSAIGFSTGAVDGFFYSGAASENHQRQINIVDTTTLVHGTHTFKMGVDLRWLEPVQDTRQNYLTPSYSSLGYSATGAVPPPGTVFSQIPASGVLQVFASGHPFHYSQNSFFVQDTWHATTKLTMTYGLRWEINPPPDGGNYMRALMGTGSLATVNLAASGKSLYSSSYHDLAPRLGVAYQLGQKQGWATVVRVGAGVFYDLINGWASTGILYNQNSTTTPITGQPFPRANYSVPLLPAAPPYPIVYGYDPNVVAPVVYQWNAAVEQSLGSRQVLSLTYLGSAGRHLTETQFFANPNSNVGNLYLTTTNANSSYNAFEIQFRRSLTGSIQAHASYTYSHSIDDTSGEQPVSQANSGTLRTSSDFDTRHSGSAGVTWSIPTRTKTRGLRLLLNGWGLDTLLQARSALPLDVLIFENGGTNLPGSPSNVATFYERPAIVPGQPLWIYSSSLPNGRRVNPAAFAVPMAGQSSTLPRNALRGFSIFQPDAALRRSFTITERMRLQFRADFFNIINHPNLADPVNELANVQSNGAISYLSNFGISNQMLARSLGTNSSGVASVFQVGGSRSTQLSLKLIF
jgi:hypothetical protein